MIAISDIIGRLFQLLMAIRMIKNLEEFILQERITNTA